MFGFLKEKVITIADSVAEGGSATFNWLKNIELPDEIKKKLSTLDETLIEQYVAKEDTPNEKSIQEKLKSCALKLGEEIYVNVVQAYLAMMDDSTNPKYKAILAVGLAYFILPADLIPDVIVGVGFTDDAAALALTFKNVDEAIKDSHRENAQNMWKELVNDENYHMEKLIEDKSKEIEKVNNID